MPKSWYSILRYTPNTITVIRILLAIGLPIMVAAVALRRLGERDVQPFIWPLVIYIVAALSDWVDGWLSRRCGWASRFGEIADPIADKLLVYSAMVIVVVYSSQICVVAVTIDSIVVAGFALLALTMAALLLVTIVRDIRVMILRIRVMRNSSVSVAASQRGKRKAVFQMTSLGVGLALPITFIWSPYLAMLLAGVVLALYAMATYDAFVSLGDYKEIYG